MTAADIRSHLGQTFDDVSPRETIQQIKTHVIAGLEALDSSARVHNTDYFNHTFAPDLVMRWGDQRERFVYVRLTDNPGAVLSDLERVGDQHPILFQVAPGAPAIEGVQAVENAARERSTLITDAGGVSQLADARRSDAVVALLTSSIAEYGRGVVDAPRAADATTAVISGFAGAREVSSDAVVSAVRMIDQLLEEPASARLHRLLQAVWIGSGGRSDLFPARVEVAPELDDDALSFLVGQQEIADLEFWRRVSSGIDLEKIGRLTAANPINLSWLIRANIDRLRARVCHVIDAPLGFDELDVESPQWTVHRRHLALRTHEFFAYVAELTEHLAELPGTPTDGLSMEELRSRSDGRAAITSVWLAGAREEVAFSSVFNEDVVHSGRLEEVAESLGGTRVRRARAILPGDKSLTVDFASSSASSVTRSVLTLTELLGHGLPLLRRMVPDVQQAVEALVKDPFAGDQPSLFDDIDID